MEQWKPVSRGEQRVLDAGCGSGIVGREALARYDGPLVVHGFDSSSEAIAVAKNALGCEGIEFWKDEAVSVANASPPYDVIFAQHLIQNLEKDGRSKTLRRFWELLGPEGQLIVGVWADNCEVYRRIYEACGTPEKLSKSSMGQDDLRATLQAAGFVCLEVGTHQLETKNETLSDLVRDYLRGSRWGLENYPERRKVLRGLDHEKGPF